MILAYSEGELFTPDLLLAFGQFRTWLSLNRKLGLFSKFPGKTKLEIKAIMMDEKLSLEKISLDWSEEPKSRK